MKIFLSHTYLDKPVVEPIAIRMAQIFGQENVFYDAWSIQPGDGIIDQMNKGLTSPDFVFFFVSVASLASKMVDLEWQNALYASTKGGVKIIPVRVDGSPMPAILMQNVWIDLHGQGIEVALQHMVSVTQGLNTFTPKHLGFANLAYSCQISNPGTLLVEVSASHLMEPNPMVAIVTDSSESEITVRFADSSPSRGGYNPAAATLTNGQKSNAFVIAPLGGAITPKHPLRIEVKSIAGKNVHIHDVLHNTGTDEWTSIPKKP